MNFRSIHAQVKRMGNYVQKYEDVQSLSLFRTGSAIVVVSNEMFMYICENFEHSEVISATSTSQSIYVDGVMYMTIFKEATDGNTEE